MTFFLEKGYVHALEFEFWKPRITEPESPRLRRGRASQDGNRRGLLQKMTDPRLEREERARKNVKEVGTDRSKRIEKIARRWFAFAGGEKRGKEERALRHTTNRRPPGNKRMRWKKGRTGMKNSLKGQQAEIVIPSLISNGGAAGLWRS